MCRQSSSVHFPVEEAVSAEEGLLVYCKPVELYNILQRRAKHSVIKMTFNLSCICFTMRIYFLVYHYRFKKMVPLSLRLWRNHWSEF